MNEKTTQPDAIGPPLDACEQCGCTDLFVRKDFPQKIGLGIVILAAGAFLFLSVNRATFHIGVWILVLAAGVDAALYWFVPKITVCYRCRAEFRRREINPAHDGFDLAVGEKYRQR